jgi:hypothetical protein
VGGPGCDRTRTRDDAVTAVAAILAATANLQNPNDVNVSRPSDALAAKQATDTTLTALLLGLGAVALLVGGVGVANTMVISVLERRPGIGLRRGDLDQPRDGPTPATWPPPYGWPCCWAAAAGAWTGCAPGPTPATGTPPGSWPGCWPTAATWTRPSSSCAPGPTPATGPPTC